MLDKEDIACLGAHISWSYIQTADRFTKVKTEINLFHLYSRRGHSLKNFLPRTIVKGFWLWWQFGLTTDLGWLCIWCLNFFFLWMEKCYQRTLGVVIRRPNCYQSINKFYLAATIEAINAITDGLSFIDVISEVLNTTQFLTWAYCLVLKGRLFLFFFGRNWH